MGGEEQSSAGSKIEVIILGGTYSSMPMEYREDFMRWCYSRPMTCKEGNGNQCVANNNPAWIGNTARGYPAQTS